MKAVTSLLLVIFLVCIAAPIFGQNKDLSGTWSGETVVPNAQDKDVITMVLKKAGDSYTGTISDSLGMLNGTPLEKVKFEKDTLIFEFIVSTGGQEIRARTTFKISGEKLVGSWETEDGATGPLEMTRTK
jgi:hypothetical protein